MKAIASTVGVKVSLISKPIPAFNVPLAPSFIQNLELVYQFVPKTPSITLPLEDANAHNKHHSIMEKYVLLVFFHLIGINMKKNASIAPKEKILTWNLWNVWCVHMELLSTMSPGDANKYKKLYHFPPVQLIIPFSMEKNVLVVPYLHSGIAWTHNARNAQNNNILIQFKKNVSVVQKIKNLMKINFSAKRNQKLP